MLAYRFCSTLFTYVIAAPDKVQAIALVRSSEHKDHWHSIEQWHTPDIWTRRAVDMALAPGIIDTIPRFVVDRKDGPVYVGIDDVPAKLSPDEFDKCKNDSCIHDMWLDALRVGTSYSEPLRALVSGWATMAGYYNAHMRALAGAWGLGPVPEWHAAILPALIALDTESTGCYNAFRDDVFELDIVELRNELKRCYDLTGRFLAWHKEALRQTLNYLAGQPSIAEMRATCIEVLKLTDWLP